MHAALVVGGCTFFLCDDFPEYCGGTPRAPAGPSPVTLHLCVDNCDAAITRAAAAGATVTMPAVDMFWGDRYGQIVDPFGHAWSFTHPLSDNEAYSFHMYTWFGDWRRDELEKYRAMAESSGFDGHVAVATAMV